MYCRITGIPEKLDADVRLPASKSLSNRALTLKKLSPEPFQINNLSDARDTTVLDQLLSSDEDILDAGESGTAIRFLVAVLASTESDKEVLLTGSSRMKQRPIGPLVEALKDLGADIQYQDHPGFPPLLIRGKRLEGGRAEMDASVSSQFISALLMVAPLMKNGLKLHLKNRPVSLSYVKMTTQLMGYFGINCHWESNNLIEVPPGHYLPRDITIESDWSSASYWYGLVALSPGGKARFKGLNKKSPQGDRIIASYMESFGVKTRFRSELIEIEKKAGIKPYFVKNMVNVPDLIPTMAALCSCFNISTHIKGTNTLSIKESDRTEVLKTELGKVGYQLQKGNNEIKGIPSQLPIRNSVMLDPCGDHRMAMAFALHAYINSNIRIKEPEVVEKSFPGFWDSLRDNGIKVEFS